MLAGPDKENDVLIEYKIKFEKNGVTITQRVEAGPARAQPPRPHAAPEPAGAQAPRPHAAPEPAGAHAPPAAAKQTPVSGLIASRHLGRAFPEGAGEVHHHDDVGG